MKKKFVFIVLLTIVFGARVFAQNFNFNNYHDDKKGYSGFASAEYIGNGEDIDMEILGSLLIIFDESLTTVEKLSKNNEWLLEQAMNEWDYKEDEIYFASLAESQQAESAIMLFIHIDEDESFDWIGWLITEDDIDSVVNLMLNFSVD